MNPPNHRDKIKIKAIPNFTTIFAASTTLYGKVKVSQAAKTVVEINKHTNHKTSKHSRDLHEPNP